MAPITSLKNPNVKLSEISDPSASLVHKTVKASLVGLTDRLVRVIVAENSILVARLRLVAGDRNLRLRSSPGTACPLLRLLVLCLTRHIIKTSSKLIETE